MILFSCACLKAPNIFSVTVASNGILHLMSVARSMQHLVMQMQIFLCLIDHIEEIKFRLLKQELILLLQYVIEMSTIIKSYLYYVHIAEHFMWVTPFYGEK